MPVDITKYPSYAFIILLIALIFLHFLALFIHIITPKEMLNKYFREPYFSRNELAIYSAFPMNHFKVFMFMRLAGWPESGKMRGLTEAYKLAPEWFQKLSRAFIVIYLTLALFFLTLLLILSIAFWAFGI